MDINYYKQYEPIFGAWHITRMIGEGSFGKVFEMVREDFGVTYKAALKTITVPASEAELLDVKADGMDDRSVRAYFGSFVEELVKEFALMSRLKGNSNIVSYENHQVIEHKNGIGWDILIQMELLTPLNRYTANHAVTIQDVIHLGIDLCRALELCQTYHIIHRDVKPENIFVSETGNFKLGDFGIARTVEKTTSGLSKKGTYTYMAPEVYKGEPYGATVDIYSLGIVLYRLLNGNRTPFLPPAPAPITHNDRENALERRLSGAPLPPPCSTKGRLAEIVLKACAYDSKERYQSPTQMRTELESLLMQGGDNPVLERDTDSTTQDSVNEVKPGSRPPIPPVEPTQKDTAPVRNTGPVPVSNMDKTVSDFPEFHPPQHPPVPLSEQSTQKKHVPTWLKVLLASAGVLMVAVFGLLVASSSQSPEVGSVSHTETEETSSGTTSQGTTLKGVPTTIDVGDYLENVYDDEGHLVEQPYFQYDGSISRNVTVYGENGKVRYVATYNLLGELEDFYLNTFEDNLFRSDFYDRFGELERSTVTYDESDGSSRIDYLDAYGNITNYDITQYNADGNREKSISYNTDGSFSSRNDYEYNADGVLFGYGTYDENGNLLSYSRYEDDENGHTISSTTYADEDHPLYHTKYDSFSRTVKELTYDDNGEIELQTDYFYDDSGFRTRMEKRGSDGELQEYTEYTYGESGKISSLRRFKSDGTLEYESTSNKWGDEEITISYDEEGAVDERTVLSYNEEGRLVSKTEYDGAGNTTYSSEFNDQGQLIQSSWYSEGVLSSKDVTEYNENGEEAKISTFEPDGSLKSYVMMVYDSNGVRTQKRRFRGDDTLSLIYDYNNEGDTIKETSFDENGELTEWTDYVYNESGKQVEATCYLADGSLSWRQTWEYNESGNLFRDNSYDENNALSSYMEYEYDTAGNRVKSSQYSADGTLQWYLLTEYDEDGLYLGSTTYNADGTPR